MRQYQQWLQLAELFDCVEDVLVWVKDREGRYRWVNRAFLINYALDRRHERAKRQLCKTFLGKTDYDLSPAFLADQFRLDDEYVLTGKRIVNRIELVGQPDGLTVWNVTNKIPLVDADGAVIGTAGITRRLNTPGQDIAPGIRIRRRYWPTCGITTTHRSPIGSWLGWRTCRSEPSNASSAAVFISRPRNTCGNSRCAWPAELWSTPTSRWRKWPLLRICRPESLHARVPSPFRPDSPGLSQALHPASQRCRSWHKSCRSRAIIDPCPAAIIRSLNVIACRNGKKRWSARLACAA